MICRSILLFTLCHAPLAARAGDNGHCLGRFHRTHAELTARQRADRSDVRALSGVTLLTGIGTVVTLKQNLIAAALFGLATGAAYVATERAGAATQANAARDWRNITDLNLILKAYAYAASHGRRNAREARQFIAKVSEDAAPGDVVLVRLREAMDRGDLCDGDRPKALDQVVAELKTAGAGTF